MSQEQVMQSLRLPLSECLDAAVTAAHAAAAILQSYAHNRSDLVIDTKMRNDLVSQADREAEQAIIDILLERTPQLGIVAEESGGKASDIATWYIDPLDGTTNFLHGIPLFAVAIALQRGDDIVASVIYNPIMDELYTAEKGGGAWLADRKRLRVAGRRHLSDAVISTGIKTQGTSNDGLQLRQLAHINPAVAGIRRSGSISVDMAWLAAGRFDALWEAGLKPWDVAPGLLMVKEAGGLVTDYAGQPGSVWNGQIVAGNETLHGALLKELKPVH